MVTFYKHHIPDWMDGTQSLDHVAYRVYHVIVQLIYLNEGPIANHEQGIAGLCKTSLRAYREHLDALVRLGKLSLVDGNRIANQRANDELEALNQAGGKRVAGGLQTPGKRVAGVVQAGCRPVADASLASNPLKNNNPGVAELPLARALRLDKTREEKTKEKKDAASRHAIDSAKLQPAPSSDPEGDLFRRGKAVLGQNAGGLIAQLLRAKGGNVALARAAIEQASTKADPREYIGAVIRAPPPDPRNMTGII